VKSVCLQVRLTGKSDKVTERRNGLVSEGEVTPIIRTSHFSLTGADADLAVLLLPAHL